MNDKLNILFENDAFYNQKYNYFVVIVVDKTNFLLLFFNLNMK